MYAAGSMFGSLLSGSMAPVECTFLAFRHKYKYTCGTPSSRPHAYLYLGQPNSERFTHSDFAYSLFVHPVITPRDLVYVMGVSSDLNLR